MKRSTKIVLGVVAAAAAAVCVVCCLIIFQYFRGSKVLEEVEQLTGAPDETVQVVPVLPEVVPGQQITTLPGQITVPAATYAQDPDTGVYTIQPGVSVITVTGTV